MPDRETENALPGPDQRPCSHCGAAAQKMIRLLDSARGKHVRIYRCSRCDRLTSEDE